VFVLTGEYSNKIESTKALEVAQDLARMHDFGVKTEAKITTMPLRLLEGRTREDCRVLQLLNFPSGQVFSVPRELYHHWLPCFLFFF
jgi:hypothetical protein